MWSSLFETPWEKPVSALSDENRAFALAAVGFHLRALGRLQEAVKPTEIALQTVVVKEDWKNASRGAENLSELYLAIGDLRQALICAEQSVELAQRSGKVSAVILRKTTVADTLHQLGRTAEAEYLFRESEQLQQQN